MGEERNSTYLENIHPCWTKESFVEYANLFIIILGYLYRICETLNELAYENNIPVILTNQISIKVEQNKNGGISEIIPALGNKLILFSK